VNRDDAGFTIDEFDVHTLERLNITTKPIPHTSRIATDFDGRQARQFTGSGTRVLQRRTQPFDEERHLRIVDHVSDADLLPRQVDAIRAMPHAFDGGTAETFLHRSDVIDSNYPRHPSATEVGTTLDRLTEGEAIGCGVIQRRHHLEVATARQREYEVARPKTRVTATVTEDPTSACTEALNLIREVGSGDGVRDVVQAHAGILSDALWVPFTAVEFDPPRVLHHPSGGAGC